MWTYPLTTDQKRKRTSQGGRNEEKNSAIGNNTVYAGHFRIEPRSPDRDTSKYKVNKECDKIRLRKKENPSSGQML